MWIVSLNNAARSLCPARAPRRRGTLHTQLPIASAASLGPALGDKRVSYRVALTIAFASSPHRNGRVLCRERDHAAAASTSERLAARECR
jgi:hypothetical protein